MRAFLVWAQVFTAASSINVLKILADGDCDDQSAVFFGAAEGASDARPAMSNR